VQARGTGGGISNKSNNAQWAIRGGTASLTNSNVISAQCFPLYSILLAMGNPTVREGGEKSRKKERRKVPHS
jgi:hypothetical protein